MILLVKLLVVEIIKLKNNGASYAVRSAGVPREYKFAGSGLQ